jgi:hypothetical protein
MLCSAANLHPHTNIAALPQECSHIQLLLRTSIRLSTSYSVSERNGNCQFQLSIFDKITGSALD